MFSTNLTSKLLCMCKEIGNEADKKFAEKSVKFLVQKAKSKSSLLNDLRTAVLQETATTGCIIVSK